MPDLDQQLFHLSVTSERGPVGEVREGHRKLCGEQFTEQSKIPPASVPFALDPKGTGKKILCYHLLLSSYLYMLFLEG